jgi:hypothetical protein
MANLIADHIKGTTWDGFMFKLEDETAPESGIYEPVDLTGCTIISQFKTTPKGGMVFEFKTSDNSITIPTPANGEFFYEERIINNPANNYIFDFQITFPSGVVFSSDPDYWRILQNVSQ